MVGDILIAFILARSHRRAGLCWIRRWSRGRCFSSFLCLRLLSLFYVAVGNFRACLCDPPRNLFLPFWRYYGWPIEQPNAALGTNSHFCMMSFIRYLRWCQLHQPSQYPPISSHVPTYSIRACIVIWWLSFGSNGFCTIYPWVLSGDRIWSFLLRRAQDLWNSSISLFSIISIILWPFYRLNESSQVLRWYLIILDKGKTSDRLLHLCSRISFLPVFQWRILAYCS